jgi:uracil-DNA glycosylase family 4
MTCARDSNCSRCPQLVASRRQIVEGSGPVKPLLMIVAEAPGESEDATGVPLCGRSGSFLRKTLASLGLGEQDYYLTNAVRCHPHDNRNPTTIEIDNCESWLAREIDHVAPRAILALGKIAQRALESIPLPYPVFHATHPAAILRNPRQLQVWESTLAEIVQKLKPTPRPRTSQPALPVDPWVEGCPDFTSSWLAVDTETDDLEEGYGKALVCWQISDGERAEFYRPPFEIGFGNPGQRVWYWNAPYDAPLLGHDLRRLDTWDDAMLMAYCTRQYERVGLKILGPLLTGISMSPASSLLKDVQTTVTTLTSGRTKEKSKVVSISFSTALQRKPQEARSYALLDAVVTSRAARVLSEQLRSTDALHTYYTTIEKPVVPILTEAMQVGVQIDPTALQALSSQLEARAVELSSRLSHELDTGPEFNPDSNPQLALALLEIGLPLRDSTPTGALSVATPALLSALKVDDLDKEYDPDNYWHRVVSLIVARRKNAKLKATYVDRLLADRDANDRIHTRYNQCVTNTNRLSSSDPNLQNIPVRGAIQKTMRRVFVAKPGHVLVKGDYSQLEVRIYAHYTQEPVLLAAYPWGAPATDVHQGVADALGIVRSDAKNTLFGAIYGAAAEKLAQTAHVPRNKTGAFLALLRERMPTLLTWQQDIADQLGRQGYIETLLGWRSYFPAFFAPDTSLSRAALREAANLPIQGSASGIVKVLMREMDPTSQMSHAPLVLTVHDEVVYEVPEERAHTFARYLREVGARVGKLCGLTVPLELSVSIGPNWGDQVELEP